MVLCIVSRCCVSYPCFVYRIQMLRIVTRCVQYPDVAYHIQVFCIVSRCCVSYQGVLYSIQVLRIISRCYVLCAGVTSRIKVCIVSRCCVSYQGVMYTIQALCRVQVLCIVFRCCTYTHARASTLAERAGVCIKKKKKKTRCVNHKSVARSNPPQLCYLYITPPCSRAGWAHTSGTTVVFASGCQSVHAPHASGDIERKLSTAKIDAD